MCSYEHPLAYKHIDLEKEFTSICNDKGYKVIDISYHHNYPEGTMNILRNNISPTSLSIRLSPDLIISKGDDTLFCELKTGYSTDIMRMEAYQLMLNQIRETQFCTPCLYVYKGAISNNELIACNAKDIIPSVLYIPDVKKNEKIKPILCEYFRCDKKSKKIDAKFSGDAYVEVSDFKNWRPIHERLIG